MAKKVLIASANNWSFCLAAERAIARADPDAQVDVLDMFRICSVYSPPWRPIDQAIERLNRKFARFLRPVCTGRDITPGIAVDTSAIPPPLSEPELVRQYRVGDAAVGLAVLSSAISSTTIQQPESTSEYGDVFLRAWRSAHLSAQIGEVVRRFSYDEVYIFNGRACYSRPFCDVLDRHARVFRYEQGASGNSYIAADESIHHPRTIANLIQSHDFSPAAGESFYLDRLRKAPGDAVNFYTSAQIPGDVPHGLAPGTFVAFFNSSSDEFAAISDDVGFGSFKTQYDAAIAMAQAARALGKRLVIRMHPHLRFKHPSWVREWDFPALERQGVLVIPPEGSCDSYSLAAAAHCIFTCGSTMGFESSFRGIPNADVGAWAGTYLGATAKVTNTEEIFEFVRRPHLPEGAREAALLYGSYVRRAGTTLPEYDVGHHPDYARIGGRIVDPIRYGVRSARHLVGPRRAEGAWGMVAGKAILESNLESRAKREGGIIHPGAMQ